MEYPINSIAVVTGSRDWTNRYKIYDSLIKVNPYMVIHGGARGADSIAGEWCNDSGKICLQVPALWEFHGRAAGNIRNVQMLEIAKAIAEYKNQSLLLLAFPLSHSIGTFNCIKSAQSMGIEVHVFDNTEVTM